MRIGVCGCGHGRLETLFAAAHAARVELLIIGGDFQAFRTPRDMRSASIPEKYRALGDFAPYYARKKLAPVLTVFVGGNHEAMGFMNEMRHGGWVCPRIYYVGDAGVINWRGLRIAGISGIFNAGSYEKGHFERAPFDQRTVRSVYHVRRFDVFKLQQLNAEQRLDVFLSHDWPRGIAWHGNTGLLLKKKPFFREEVMTNTLGNPATEQLLHTLKPRFWFASHLHVEFAASVVHQNNLSEDECTSLANEALQIYHLQQQQAQGQFANAARSVSNPDEIDISLEESIIKSSCESVKNPDEIDLSFEEEAISNQNDSQSNDKNSDKVKSPANNQASNQSNRPVSEQTSEQASDRAINQFDESACVKPIASFKRQTEFLALDKVGNGRSFFRTIEIKAVNTKDDPGQSTAVDVSRSSTDSFELFHDREWLAICRALMPWFSTDLQQIQLPERAKMQRLIKEAREWIDSNISNEQLRISQPEGSMSNEEYNRWISSQGRRFNEVFLNNGSM